MVASSRFGNGRQPGKWPRRPREFEELQRLRAFERRVYRINDLPAEIADAIESSKMNPAHDHLNKLLDEK